MGLDAFSGLRVIESPYMTITVTSRLSTERTLARVFGGRWWPKTTDVPSPNFIRTADTIIGHPATVATLKARLTTQGEK